MLTANQTSRTLSLVDLASGKVVEEVACGRKPSAVMLTPDDCRVLVTDQAVAKHKGKIVVVDLWGTWCIPCQQKFPAFVELSKKYADRNVVFVSWCLPIVESKELPKTALDFLKTKKATFPNFLLDDYEEWGERLRTNGAPCRLHLRDRRGT